jgi:ABC-type nitrate/sulfonate/bicarbonate transport system permease component
MQASLHLKLARAGIVLAFFALWEILARSGAINPLLLPSATDVLRTIFDLFGRADLRTGILVTGGEVAVGFLLAIPIGFLIGFFIAENRYFGEVVRPLLFFAFSIPKSMFLPMFILIFGIGFDQKVAYGFFSTVFIVIMSTSAAVESVKPEHLLVARSYGATRWQRMTRVYLPSMMPILLEAVRISMIFMLTGVLLAEMYASRSGLGHLIANWGENFMVRQLLAGVLLIAAFAIVFNEIIRRAEMRCSHWRT